MKPMEGKKPSLIMSLLADDKAGKGPKEKMGPGEPTEDEDEAPDEGESLSANLLDAMKTDDPSSFYEAFCALMDHHLAKDEDEADAAPSDRLLPSLADDSDEDS